MGCTHPTCANERNIQFIVRRLRCRECFIMKARMPLPRRPFEPVVYTVGTVAPDCHVKSGKAFYSVPWRLIAQKVTVRAAGDVVQIVPSIEPRACTGTDQRHALARQGSLLKSLVLEEDLARPLFDSLDTQGVGLLSKDQVAAWLRTDRESMDWSEVEVDALIATMDTNSDGYVSYSELSVALHAASLSGGIDIYANRLGSAISRRGRKHIMSAEFKAALLAR